MLTSPKRLRTGVVGDSGTMPSTLHLSSRQMNICSYSFSDIRGGRVKGEETERKQATGSVSMQPRKCNQHHVLLHAVVTFPSHSAYGPWCFPTLYQPRCTTYHLTSESCFQQLCNLSVRRKQDENNGNMSQPSMMCCCML